MTELMIIGSIVALIMLYLGWKIFAWLTQPIIDLLSKETKPSANWNMRLRPPEKNGPWGPRRQYD